MQTKSSNKSHFCGFSKSAPASSWGQVKYGYAENVNQMRQRLRYDIMYLENISLVLDLKILLFTIRTCCERESDLHKFSEICV